MALSTKGMQKPGHEPLGLGMRLLANAKFEMLLFALLLLTAAAVIWKDPLLERSMAYTPQSVAKATMLPLSDADNGGKTWVRQDGPLSWTCELRSGQPYPYCGYELFFDGNKGRQGLDLSKMRSMRVSLIYHGAARTFRVHLKNFDPRYSRSTNDDTPKFLRVEASVTPGKLQTAEFVQADFGVADWWMQKHKLPPEFGHPQFDNVTSMNFETGSEATYGLHHFEIKEIVMRSAILSDAQWYSMLLGIWIMMIVVYLGFRVVNLRRALKDRQTLQALALHDAQEAARHDHLTRILNRRGMVERFTELMKDRVDAVAVTVILIDIDHFKQLNDTYGHDKGDEVLASIAGVISRNVRSVDIVARWGGEEFIVACVDIDRKGAQALAEKIRDRIEHFDFGTDVPMTASFGIHWSYTVDPELPQLVSLADIALYAAKANGRNCVQLHRPGMSKAA